MTNAELFVAVQRWAAANYGLPAEHVTIRLRGLAEPVSLPIFTATLAAPITPGAEKDEQGTEHEDESLPLYIQEILQTLREVGEPLSTTRLKEEMDRRGRRWGFRTLSRYLAQLVQDGTLENPEQARPRGYRLPESGEGGNER